eukprot:8907598-Ditylum_brightwellii.AAC.1
MPTTTPPGKRKFYCEMHGRNRTHNTKDCFELKWRTKGVKPNANRDDVVKSSNEENKLNEYAPAAAGDNDSSASCLLSDNSNSTV